jgi:heptosyltransferase III
MRSGAGRQSRTLIIFPGALGDLICFLPAVHALHTRHPESALELMARWELARFAVGRTPIVRAHSIDRLEVAQLFGAAREIEAARHLFGAFTRIYSFFALHNDQFRTTLATLAPEASFYPFRPPGAGHVARAYLDSLGLRVQRTPDVPLGLLPADAAAARKLLARVGLAARSFLLLLPGSGSRAKNWPAPNFVALARLVEPRIKSLCLLGPAETELTAMFHAARIATLGGLELGEVAALAAHARLFVGNDSGVSHLAAAAGAPGVVLFGPTDPERWCPLGAVRVVRGEAMAKLSVESVAGAIALPIVTCAG